MIAQGLVDRLRPRSATRGPGPKASAAARRRARGRRRLGRRSRIALVALLAALVVLGSGWLWFRNSPLVAVRHVTIAGESGPDAAQIQRCAGLGRPDDEHARRAAEAATHRGRAVPGREGPQGHDAVPARHADPGDRAARRSGRSTAAGTRSPSPRDGTLLQDLVVSQSLPAIPVRVPPGGSRVTDPAAAGAIDAARGGARPAAGRRSARSRPSPRTGSWPSSAAARASTSATQRPSREVDRRRGGARRPRIGGRLVHRCHRPGPARRGRRQRSRRLLGRRGDGTDHDRRRHHSDRRRDRHELASAHSG